jgi:hypothetical protein
LRHTFFSCCEGNYPLLHVPNKQAETITIILALVGVVREPIDQLAFICLLVAAAGEVSRHFVVSDIIFLSQ